MKCPYCGIDATYQHNLARHLSGKAGHGIPDAKADQIARADFDGSYRPEAREGRAGATRSVIPPRVSPEPATSVPPPARHENEYAAFLEALYDMMVANKALPKYQFERRVDAFLDLFLPDLLSAHFGHPVGLIVPEFPLKKDANWQSTNVDSLLAMTDRDTGRIRYWLFVELKTDDSSVRDDQIDTYERAMHRTMPSLIEEIRGIRARTAAPAKYSRLLERLEIVPSGDRSPIRFIYLAPAIPTRLRRPPDLAEPRLYPLTFAELGQLPVTRFPESWAMFRRLVLPALAGHHA